MNGNAQPHWLSNTSWVFRVPGTVKVAHFSLLDTAFDDPSGADTCLDRDRKAEHGNRC